MDQLPILLSLRGRSVLVVGEGAGAAAKVRLLGRAGADVTLAARVLPDELRPVIDHGAVRWIDRPAQPSDLRGMALLVVAGAAAGDDLVAAARRRRIAVNVVDHADLSDFTFPAIVDRGPVVVAIGTGGAAPVLARRLRAAIEAVLPARIGELARFAARYRDAVATAFSDSRERRRFWERVFDGPAADAVLRGSEGAAHREMLAALNRSPKASAAAGSVHIVGAGPGDPDLLTLRALRLMQQADVVLHDALVAPDILDLLRRDAERIPVGKGRGRPSFSQDRINRLLAERAQAGQRVLRLKAGDPFVFGRGGEELDYLRRRGIQAAVVPGITAALGCAAAAGLPLTHRDHADRLTLATAERQPGSGDTDWPALAAAGQTLALYMGIGAAPRIAGGLLDAGMSPATPVAVIENGTRPDQRTLFATLAALPEVVAGRQVRSPALIVIGDSVRLADGWAAARVSELAAG